LVTIIKKVVL